MADKKCVFLVRVFMSKKGNKTYALCADLGYTVKFLTFNQNDVAELLRIPVSELIDKPVGDYPV